MPSTAPSEPGICIPSLLSTPYVATSDIIDITVSLEFHKTSWNSAGLFPVPNPKRKGSMLRGEGLINTARAEFSALGITEITERNVFLSAKPGIVETSWNMVSPASKTATRILEWIQKIPSWTTERPGPLSFIPLKVATVELSQGASFCSGKLPEISPETDVETIWRFWSTKTMVPSWILKLQPAVSTRSTEDFRLTFKLLRMREQKAREEMKWGSRVPKEPTPLEVKLWRIRLGYSKKQRKLSSTVPESDPPAGAIRVSESTHNAYITLEMQDYLRSTPDLGPGSLAHIALLGREGVDVLTGWTAGSSKREITLSDAEEQGPIKKRAKNTQENTTIPDEKPRPKMASADSSMLSKPRPIFAAKIAAKTPRNFDDALCVDSHITLSYD